MTMKNCSMHWQFLFVVDCEMLEDHVAMLEYFHWFSGRFVDDENDFLSIIVPEISVFLANKSKAYLIPIFIVMNLCVTVTSLCHQWWLIIALFPCSSKYYHSFPIKKGTMSRLLVFCFRFLSMLIERFIHFLKFMSKWWNKMSAKVRVEKSTVFSEFRFINKC